MLAKKFGRIEIHFNFKNWFIHFLDLVSHKNFLKNQRKIAFSNFKPIDYLVIEENSFVIDIK
jgi:hypothetical protein